MHKHLTHKSPSGFTLIELLIVIVNPVSIAEQSHITQTLLGTGIIASYLVLVELWNSDSSKNTDDGNDNQQFYEGEA